MWKAVRPILALSLSRHLKSRSGSSRRSRTDPRRHARRPNPKPLLEELPEEQLDLLMEEKSAPVEEPVEAPVEDEFVSSWRLPVTIAGASLFVAGCAAFAGVALWRNRDSFQDDCPVLLVDDRDREISNFENVNWDAQVHGDGSVQEAEM